ncbi:mRNA-decapping enzyme subunit 1, putative [Babesia caballi]|uniref:mRNA-decapping enzyme subunit 1, putative n=1 Tax=Babesia caballi TaxID=5871 RepID=A0AAV4LP07_BABCB|nr:mRNA-decapping enzyme subunit 1, putative [Babesia caballi]
MEFADGRQPPQGAGNATSSMDEVKRMRGQLSLKLLRSLDEHVDTILFQTPFVSAYELSDAEQWVRAGMEGFLYLLQRTAEPRHSFILVNRKSERHLMEYITPEFQLAADRNFIFYKGMDLSTQTMQNIRGLWFYDEGECLKTFNSFLSVTINREPLSGFGRQERSDVVPAASNEAPPKQTAPSNTVYTPSAPHVRPALRPKAHLPQDGFSGPDGLPLKKKEGYMHPGVYAHQRVNAAAVYTHSVQSAAAAPPNPPDPPAPAPSPDTFARYPMPGAPAHMMPEDPQRFVNLLQPLVAAPNHPRPVFAHPSLGMGERRGPRCMPPPQHHLPHPAEGPFPYDDTYISVSFDMLCSAFCEAMRSEEFMSIVWRRLSEKAARNAN